MELRIRHATMADLTAVTAVETECFPTAEAATEKDFAARLAVYPEYFWLLEICIDNPITDCKPISGNTIAESRPISVNIITDSRHLSEKGETTERKNTPGSWKLISFVNGMVTDEADLCDEMYENASMHDQNGAWQMIFGVNTLPQYRNRGYAEMVLRRVIEDARLQGRKGIVLTCKDKMLHYYAKFGFVNEGVSESVHGNVMWYQMRLIF